MVRDGSGLGLLGVVAPFPPVTCCGLGFACGGSLLRVWERKSRGFGVSGTGGDTKGGRGSVNREPGAHMLNKTRKKRAQNQLGRGDAAKLNACNK